VEELFEFASALNIVKDLKGSVEIDVAKRWRGECAMADWDQVYKDWQSWTDPLKLNLAINALSKQHKQCNTSNLTDWCGLLAGIFSLTRGLFCGGCLARLGRIYRWIAVPLFNGPAATRRCVPEHLLQAMEKRLTYLKRKEFLRQFEPKVPVVPRLSLPSASVTSPEYNLSEMLPLEASEENFDKQALMSQKKEPGESAPLGSPEAVTEPKVSNADAAAASMSAMRAKIAATLDKSRDLINELVPSQENQAERWRMQKKAEKRAFQTSVAM
jgi:hypothetical protein